MSALRGCLAVLVGGIAFLAVLAWFALPSVAGALVTAGLVTSGLSGTGTTVVVEASPPLKLVELRADSIEIRSTAVSWRGIAAATLELHLTGVDLASRSAGTVTGRLDGVTIQTGQGPTPVERIDVDGPSSAIRATLSLDAATVARLATAAVETTIGRQPTSVELLPPDRAVVTLGGQRVEGRIAVAGGALVADVPGFGQVVLVQPTSDVRLALQSVSILPGGGATILGILDPTALGMSR